MKPNTVYVSKLMLICWMKSWTYWIPNCFRGKFWCQISWSSEEVWWFRWRTPTLLCCSRQDGKSSLQILISVRNGNADIWKMSLKEMKSLGSPLGRLGVILRWRSKIGGISDLCWKLNNVTFHWKGCPFVNMTVRNDLLFLAESAYFWSWMKRLD